MPRGALQHRDALVGGAQDRELHRRRRRVDGFLTGDVERVGIHIQYMIGCRPGRKRGVRPNQWRCQQMAEAPPPPEELCWPTSSSRTMSRAPRISTPKYSAAAWSFRRADLCRIIEQPDHHQRRRRPDRRQADGHPGDATRFRPGQQLPQYLGKGRRGRVRRMERPGFDFLTPPNSTSTRSVATSAIPTVI